MIRLENITKIYNKGKINEFCALKDINLDIERGDFMAITGRSGAGKSTLLHILGCIDTATSGKYELLGTDVSNYKDRELSHMRNKYFGFVMQDFALINNLSVFDNITLPALLSGYGFKDISCRAEEITEKIGIGKLLRKNVNQLSGGERQRVAIARALINDPAVLIADEPTGNLDSENAHGIMMLFEAIHKEGVTVIVVTHDEKIAMQFDRQIVISDGKLLSNSVDKT